MRDDPPDTQHLSRILVLQLCPIGDTLFGTPALRALRRRFPRAHITAVTWAPNREILEGNPNVDRLVTCRKATRLPRLLSTLAEEEYDAVVGLSNIGSWLTLFTGAAVRVGFNSQTLGWLYTASVPDRRDAHAVDYCLDVVGALGAAPQGRHLDLPIGEKERAWAATLLSHGGAAGGTRLRFAMHPGGRYFPLKRWPVLGYAYVADYLAGQYGAEIVIVGGPDDVLLARQLVEGCRLAEPVVAAGKAGLKQTAALIERCDMFLGNDSAPMHMAVATGTPVVALFGPTSVDNFRPLGPHDVVVHKEVPCSPCFRWLGGNRQHLAMIRPGEAPPECMRSITVRDVIAAIERQIDDLGLRSRLGLPRPPALPVAVPELFETVSRRRRIRSYRARGQRAAILRSGRFAARHKVQESDDL